MFDRTVDTKGLKRKDSKEAIREFLTMKKRRINTGKIGPTREQNLQESSKDFAELKEYKFTLQ